MGNVFKILTYKQISGKSDQFPHRFTIEINNNKEEDWIVHIHYRNLRLELSVDEFIEFFKGIKEAKINLDTLKGDK